MEALRPPSALTKHVHAYEAHGGRLSQAYVDSQPATLRQVLPARLRDEWSGIDPDPSNWSLTVTFVAHSASVTGSQTLTIEGVCDP